MTCFVFFLSFPLSLHFDWTFEILSICLLFCFVIFWMLCYDVVYEKKNYENKNIIAVHQKSVSSVCQKEHRMFYAPFTPGREQV